MNSRDPHWYLHIGRAAELSGRDRLLYRSFEALPAVLSILTLGGLTILSFVRPAWAAYFIIVFSIYWLFKTVYLSSHLRYNFRRMQHAMETDWNARIAEIPGGTTRAADVFHLVIFPFYREPYTVIAESVSAILESKWDAKKISIVLAVEERAGEEQQKVAERVKSEFGARFHSFLITTHPSDVPGELAGKGSNISYAAEEARKHILDAHNIAYERVLVSAFDIDTIVYPHYFGCLTWHFLTAEQPLRSSYQPVPLYNNNIWHAPMLSRVIAYSSSFWQMIQQERPEKLATFSSHAVPFVALKEAGYWQRNVVSEDSRIFWNLFFRYNGDYRVVPLAYPVSMDANAGRTIFETAGNIYKQHRRWTYGAENVAYILFASIHNKQVSFIQKIRAASVQIEGFWSLSTHPLILFAVGWLPLFIGGRDFSATVLSYNLPVVARTFLTAAMIGLIISGITAMALVPKRPAEYTRWKSLLLMLQWILVPFTMVVFSAIPGLESQLRLMAGRYLGFWVTPKRTASAVSLES